MEKGQCHVGTSGWSYPHWAKGRFYPKGLKQGDWLRFFAEHFSTVEVNMTFYRLPTSGMVARWREVTPEDFRFAVKLWRRVTHEKRLSDCEGELKPFLEATAELGPKRGPLLVQLPPSLRQDTDLLEGFLANLKRVVGDAPWRVTVEFRHKDWLSEATCAVLDRHGVALCLADMPKCPFTEPNNASFVYMRRHGPAGSYAGYYPPEQVADDATRVRGWLGQGRDVYVYYNNDIDGYAIDNARGLLEQVAPSTS